MRRGEEPVFGMVLWGGPLTGALIRDIHLANELSSRGYRVHTWWAMDRPKRSPLRREIKQHWLFSIIRYWGPQTAGVSYDLKDALGRAVSWFFPEKYWINFFQRQHKTLDDFMKGFLLRVCDGVEQDDRLVKRFAQELTRAGVTHVLPTVAALCPWVEAARALMDKPPEILVTFAGYEVYANYYQDNGQEGRLYRKLREVAAQSPWPAIAHSRDYVRRVVEDIGVAESSLRPVHPGVPPPMDITRNQATEKVSAAFKSFRPDVPLITYLGRRDAEKGIDLLLYAASLLRQRGIDLQLAVCGPTLHGACYARACRLIARNLRYPVLWSDFVSDELRAALFAASRAVVYPSIHREAFGMVAVEALAHGTPVVVPDRGGVREAVQADGHAAGLLFRVWDSGHLAEQIARLLKDEPLWQRLSEAGPRVAEYYSVRRMTDRVLEQMNLPLRP